MAAGVVCLICDYTIAQQEMKKEIQRNSAGNGKKIQELEIQIGDGKRETFTLEVQEQIYSEEEIQSMFRRSISKIEKEMLGKNESFDRVTEDLNLMTTISGEPIRITWEVDQYEILNVKGELQEENLKSEGTLVKLEAVLAYTEKQEAQVVHQFMVMIYPKEKTSKGIEELKKQVEEMEKLTREKKLVSLPEEIEGEQVQYYKKMDDRGLILILMGILIGILLYVLDLQNQEKEQKDKKKEMQLDYPEIVSELALFLGAGMTVKRSWTKIAREYERRKTPDNIRIAYEEMLITCREMESGITESESYERFGRRCNETGYIRLGALLSQNLRKGTKGLNEMLRMEVVEAFEERKARAKMLGEEAGTKLLIPMFIMLAIVLIIVIIPAFLSMQM